MSAIRERNQALSILNSRLTDISNLLKESHHSKGRGALLVYARDIIEGRFPGEFDYMTKEEILDIFDEPTSKAELAEMIDNYEQNSEGIMTLITSHSNATFFVTIKLK